MPLDYQLDSSLFRVKSKVSGNWVDDPDVADPSVTLPATLLSADPTARLAWSMAHRSTSKVKIKVTFRDDSGVEVAGSFTAYAFGVVPLHAAETAIGAVRPAVEKHPSTLVWTSSAVPLVLDELGVNDLWGLRFSSITSTGTRMFVRVEELGGDE